MNNKKIYSLVTILLITLSMGIGSLNLVTQAALSTEPIFEGFVAEGFGDFQGINFPNNTVITVEYSVDRLVDISGVVIVGSGSNLTLTPATSISLNFSNSQVDRSYYTGSFNLTSLTSFKGYAWIGEINNGTYEVLENFNHLGPWHYLYVTEEGTPPEFQSITNATSVGFDYVFYSPSNQTNNTITIRYVAYGANENDTVTLALSTYRDTITDASLGVFTEDVTFIEMDYEEGNETYGQVIYNASFEFTERTIFFSANNSYGWDMWGGINEVRTQLVVYMITNGFYFESKPLQDDKITDLDNIEFNITTYNSTDIEEFGISYYVTESIENDTEIVPLTTVSATLDQNYTLENIHGNNDTIREYLVSIGSLSSGNLLYYEGFNLYYDSYYNETGGSMKLIYIYDSTPELKLYPVNNTYTNDVNVTFYYEIDTARGVLYSAEMDYDDGTPITDVYDPGTNTSIHIFPELTGDYNATLFISVNMTRVNDVPILVNNSISTMIYLDFEEPILDIIDFTSNDSEITDGYVEIYFDYNDVYAGIGRVWIFWDDGIVQNVTDESFAFHNYVEDGTYNITIMVEDKAGNQFNSTITYIVELVIETPTTTTPYATLAVLLSLFVTGYVLNKRKNGK